MFPSWSQHVQGWTCSRDVLLETSVHWIFDQFQARGFKPTGNHRQFPRARHFCSLSMMGNVAHAELHHGKKLHYCTLQLWIPPGQHEPPFTLRQLTASVKLSDGAMIEGYKTATTPIFNWFSFFQTATFFPHPPRHQCLGWDKEECFLLSRGRGKGYLVYQ